MCKSQWIWIEFDKSHRIGKMIFYLTSAVTHLNFYIMWPNHKHRYIAVDFFKDIYLPLLMPQNIVWNFWCLNLWYFARFCRARQVYHSSVLCEEASTTPECLYILTLCLFLWKLKINNFWKSFALLKESKRFAYVLVHCVKSIRPYNVRSLSTIFLNNIQPNFKISFPCPRFLIKLCSNWITER